MASTGTESVDVSVIIPTCNGGELLRRTLQAIFDQKTARTIEVVIIDSGSEQETMEVLRAFPIVLVEIPNTEFNHGLTRDLGAERSTGEFLLFINQDAEPGDERWLDQMIQPMIDDPAVLATQGGIRERDDMPRFFWDSCGPRFYFTSESVHWIRRYHGIGFSTVNAAIRRSVWQQHRFGEMAIFEDKGFQRQVHRTGREIVHADGYVLHTHDYDYHQLWRRCQDEGFGWRLVGEDYSRWQAIRDTLLWKNYARLLLGILRGRIRKLSEVVYPFLRPRWVWRGNHKNQGLTR